MSSNNLRRQWTETDAGDADRMSRAPLVPQDDAAEHPFSANPSLHRASSNPELARAEPDLELTECKRRAVTESEGAGVENEESVANGDQYRREYSETPSWIELKKWKRQLEQNELANMSLHQLAREGDTRRMRMLLDNISGLGNLYRRVNERDEDGLSPLHYAARYNHFAVVRLLIDQGGDVNIKGEDDIRPLHFAARYKRSDMSSAITRSTRARSGSDGEIESPSSEQLAVPQSPDEAKEVTLSSGRKVSVSKIAGKSVVTNLETESIITLLVEQGADANAQDTYGMTPLHYAAMRGNAIVAQQLLKCPDVAVDKTDKTLMTPLHTACAHGFVEVAELLLQEGAHLLAPDDQQSTPLHLAAQDGHLDIVHLLLRIAGHNRELVLNMLKVQDYERNTPLHLAVDSGHFEVARYLLRNGADANAHRVMLNTPLHLACNAGDVRIVELLFEYGAEIECRNADQSTPLHRACALNHYKVAEYLIEKNAELEARDNDGYTPLLIGACEGRSETVASLAHLGANLAATDKLDRTAIYLGALENNVDVLDVLLSNADVRQLVDKADRYNCTPVHIAAKNGFLESLRLLLDKGAQIDAKNEEEQTPLHLAAANGRTRIVRELVRRSKLCVADEDEGCCTALHVAAAEGHDMVVRELLDAGADIAARNSVMWTPLDCAAANGWERTAALLLDYDAPLDPMDKAKTTPLHLASTKGHAEVVSLLLKRGASIDLLDAREMNCLDLAIENGHKQVALAIIHDENWKKVLRNAKTQVASDGSVYRDTPVRKLIRRLPTVAGAVFDRCTQARGDMDRPEYSIAFDYEFLDDTYCNWKFSHDDSLAAAKGFGKQIYDENGRLTLDAQPYTADPYVLKENHPLMIMVQSERVHLLSHPLVIGLLRHKWVSYGRYVYYSSLLLYMFFIAMLTAYVIIVPAPYTADMGVPCANNETAICTLPQSALAGECEGVKNVYDGLAQFCSIGIIVLAVVHVLKEFYQIYQRGYHYISIENFIEWCVYVGCFILMFDISPCQTTSGIRQPWQWQIGAAAIFLAWFNLVLMIRKFPTLGIYVVMFTDVFRTFMRFLAVFVLFICAFAMTFFTLFQNQPEFSNPLLSMLKTTVMMIGEFEYTSIFDPHPEDPSLKLPYPYVSYPMFVCFILLMTLIIMNLLIGLAVDDIKGVQDKAVLKKYAMQVELVLHVEQALPERLRRRWVIGRETLYPNIRGWYEKIKRTLVAEPTQLSVTTIARQLNREIDDFEQVRQVQEQVVQSVEKLRRRVDGMQTDQRRLHSMMFAIINHFDIHWEDQDEFRAI